MTTTSELVGSKTIAFTTFRKDGTPVSTATWIYPLADGRVGFWTSSKSGKVKRLAHTSRVTLQPSDSRGRVTAGSQAVEGTAEIVRSGPVFDEVIAGIKQKYGFMTKVTKLLNTLGHIGKDFPYGDLAVVVTLPPST